MISKGITIKFIREYLHLIIVGSVLGTLLVIIGMLISLYSDLSVQRRNLIELKNEYDSYVLMYKKIFDEYRMMKGDSTSITNQPEVDHELATSFDIVNRDHQYLAESAYDFGKNYNLEDSLRFLYDSSRYETINKNKRPIKKQTKNVVRKKYTPTSYQRRSDCVFQWPIAHSQFWLSSRYGPRKQNKGQNKGWKFHYGIDLAAIEGTPVQAAGRGVVAEVSYSKKGYGNTIVIAHAGDCTTRYAHLKSIAENIHRGKKIESGECIGCVGTTGHVQGKNGRKSASHLHFEIKEHGKHIDPLLMLT